MLHDDLKEIKASLDRMRPWQAIIISCIAGSLFAYYGPRWRDDTDRALQLTALASLKAQAIVACNDVAKENNDKITFASEKASFALKLDKQYDVPTVMVRQGDYVCFAPQGGDAQVGTDDFSN